MKHLSYHIVEDTTLKLYVCVFYVDINIVDM